MPWIIHKTICDGEEFLPSVVDTPLWAALDPDQTALSKKSARQIAGLYDAIAKRENHYQTNTPPAFGDPKFAYLSGVVFGYLAALELTEEDVGNSIVVRKRNGHKVLVIDKLTRPDRYYQARRENREDLAALGI